MNPLDLSAKAPRSCYAELDGLMLMPRTIDKLRGRIPGGNPDGYFINGPIKGISGFLLDRLGVTEEALFEAVVRANTEDDVAQWLRERVDIATYPAINASLRHIRPKHAEDPELFRDLYAETLAAHPNLEFIVDIVDADDTRIFNARFPK